MKNDPFSEHQKATLSAATDMTFMLSDDFDLSAFAPERDLEVTGGDAAKALAIGAMGAVEGGAETYRQGQGYLGEKAREMGVPEELVEAANYTPQGLMVNYIAKAGELVSDAKEWVTETLTEDGKQALNTLPVTETPEGDWKLSTDPAVWSMQLAQGIGYMVPTVATAISTGGLSSGAAIQSLTNLAIRSGAKPELAAKAARLAHASLSKSPTATVAMGSDVGSQGNQAKESILNADLSQLAKSEVFQEAFLTVDEDPKFTHLSDIEKLEEARKRTADRASRATMTDPLTLGSSVAATLVGDLPLASTLMQGTGKGLVKSIAAGAAREAPTEAAQGGVQQYVSNKVSNEFAGTEVDLMDGVALSAVNEGAIGGAVGATMGAGGAYRGGDALQDDKQTDHVEGGEPSQPTQGVDDSQTAPQHGMPESVADSSELSPKSSKEGQEAVGQKVDTQDALKQKLVSSRQALRKRRVLSDPQDYAVQTLKLAYAMDQEQADMLVDRLEQGDHSAEAELYALADRASELDLDASGLQQLFDQAVSQRNAAGQRKASNTERYIQALEQGREQVLNAKHSPPTYKPYHSPEDPRIAQWEAEEAAKDARQFDPDMARAELLKREAEAERSVKGGITEPEMGGVTRPFQHEQERQAAEQQRTEQQAQREQGQKPISDFTDTVKKTKSMRKRLKQRMAKANPQLAEALLESLRHAPERIAAFEAEAERRKAYEESLPENRERRAQAEALFNPKSHEAVTVPDFERHAVAQVINELRERGEKIIAGLPEEEQTTAREDLNKAQAFVTTRLRMMMDEAKANRTKTLKDFTPRYQPKPQQQPEVEEEADAEQVAKTDSTDDEATGKQSTETEHTPQEKRAPAQQESSTETVEKAEDNPSDKTPEATPAKEKEEKAVASERIEDVGEKIGGARKDIWQAYSSSLEGKDSEDIKVLPLSKVWPQPNYTSLLKAGVSSEALSLFRAIRDIVPAKPRASYKVTRWATQVSMLRDIGMTVIDGALPVDDAIARLSSSSVRGTLGLSGKAALYEAMGHDQSLSDFEVSSGAYSLFEGTRYDPPKTIWTVTRKAKGGLYGNWPRVMASGGTQTEAIERFKTHFAELKQGPTPKKNTSFDLYTKAGEAGFFIGKKVGRTYIDLAGPIEKLAEARAMLTDQHDVLAEKLAGAKYTPPPRRDTNQPRVGEDLRQGGDVTAEDFAKTFGFRGVEFGNWVEQTKRQRMVNDAFDGLMDLAAVLGIPPKAISLNGELGLAFGARGAGGRNPAAAHYEPGRVVINLTKNNGAGSLGHEWWHALDNYFGKMNLGIERGQGAATYLTRDADHPSAVAGVRQEMRDAFEGVMKAIQGTELYQRSRQLDNKRTKDYWSTHIEMSARSFESYLIGKLADQNASNDFLANILSQEAWAGRAVDKNTAEAYPYPTDKEGAVIRRAFDRLFNSIESEETGKGHVRLYSREGVTSGYQPKKGLPVKHVELGVKQWLKDYKGGAGVKVRVVNTQKDAETLLGQSFPDATVHAFYHDRSASVIVVADNMPDMKTLRQKLRHEVLVHHGLKSVVGDSEYQKILVRVFSGRQSKHLKGLWEQVLKNYADQDAVTQVEEVLAHAAELERNTLQQWWDRVIEAIAHALRKVGLMKPGDMTQAEMNNIVQTLIDRVKSVNHWDPDSAPEDGEKAGTGTSKLSTAKFSRVPADSKVVHGKALTGSTVKDLRLKAKSKSFIHVGQEVVNDDSGLVITISKAGIKHTLSKAQPDLISSVPYLNELIRLATYLGSQPDRKDNLNVKAHHYFGVKFGLEGRVKDVVIDAREMPDGKFYYDHSFERDESASGGNSSGPRLHTQGPIYPEVGAKADSKKITPDTDDVKFSKTQSMTFDEAIQKVGQGETVQVRFKSALSAIGMAVKGVAGGRLGLGAVSLRQLADLSKDTLPMVKTYVDTVHRMLTRRNQMAFESAEIAQHIRKWAAKNKDAADQMFGLAHDATVEGVDPDKPFVSAEEAIQRRIEYLENVNEGSHKTKAQMDEIRELRRDLQNEPRRRAQHARLKTQFDALPEQAKAHYREMRDNYKQRHNEYKQLLEQQIMNAEIDGRVKKKRIAELRSMFDLQEVNAPYFPLARFGDYWLSAMDESGEQRYMMFDSEAEQRAMAKRLREKGFEVSTGYKMEGNPAINGASLSFVTDLMNKIDDTSLNVLKKDEIKDSIYQMYLQALPSRSMRKQFIHRKKVKGWSNDALRAMASNMMKGAYQLARMEYSDELTKQAAEAKKAATISGNNQAGRYAEELMKRHEWVMNPTHSKAAQMITSVGFVWMLGVSPAAAAINTTQNFVVALPILGSKFGAGKASSMLMTTMKEFVTGKGSIKGKLTKYDEKDAYQQWVDMGLIDATNANDLAGMAEAENWQYNEHYEKAMNMVSALFHKAEVFNRETTAMAAYRLARKKGMSHDGAVREAADITWDAHFDYTNANRARYMQSPSMKVITQFKQYSQNMTYFLARNAYLSFKGLDPEVKAMARKQLIGSLGMTTLLGGVSALPLSALYALANTFKGDEDEPWDAETEFKGYVADVFGKDLSDLILHGVGGEGLSSRISLDGLWLRDANRDVEGQDLWTHYAQQVAGPVLGGVVMGALRGTQDIADGHTWRGVEKIVPKFVRDPMKAVRYAEEGALTYRGDAYKEKDDFTGLQLLMQSFGFSDHALLKQYQLNNAIKGYEKHIVDRRRDLMTAYWLGLKQSDTALMLETQKNIARFNRKNPRIPIKTADLRRSVKARQRYASKNERGIQVNDKLRYLNEA
ncbi:PLxRFG domain-containing protein [Grimontia marina]|uniref:Large polyvalent protein-associated domain-containing protein n=1 Tax=Grimontia marina TaxID=646534 RepID=A0A128F0F3_9GAMM|nr:PLxRFG domain-containing protein [Grimontia marina]CZF79751.1 hypothetical protein GMA8713_01115 [Grimontia marina]